MWTKQAESVSIVVAEGAQDFQNSLVTLSVGGKITIDAAKQTEDTVTKIEVNEWLKTVRVHYSSGSIVNYKGFRMIFSVKAHD